MVGGGDMKQIVVKVTFEIKCPALPENYCGETDIEKMRKMEEEQMQYGAILMDLFLNEEPKVEVTIEDI